MPAGARTGQEGGRHMGRCYVLSVTMSFGKMRTVEDCQVQSLDAC